MYETIFPTAVAKAMTMAALMAAMTICAEPTTASADTLLSGSLTDGEDHHWTIENSPYILTTSVTVRSGSKLTIDAGVKVKGRYRAQLRIYGVLEANGTKKDPVVFKSDSSTQRWEGIRFSSSSGSSRISHANISGSDDTGLLSEGDDLVIEDSVIKENERYNLRSVGARLRIVRTRFSDSSQGIVLLNGEDATIQDSTFENHGYRAIDISNAHTLVSGCTIDGSNLGIDVDDDSTFSIENSVFTNLEKGVLINITGDSSGGRIVHSTFDKMQDADIDQVGAAVWVNITEESNASVSLENSIVTRSDRGFKRVNNAGPTLVETFIVASNLWNNDVSFSSGVETDGSVIDVRPGFVDHANGDFRLAANSPCIDAGNLIDGIDFDIAGDPRNQGDAPDMGAFERLFEAPARCGDGVTDDDEQCDDGNASNWDGCTNVCELPVCGDGFVNDPSEECDEGTKGAGDRCTATCKRLVTVPMAEEGSGGCAVQSAGPNAPTGVLGMLFIAMAWRRFGRTRS